MRFKKLLNNRFALGLNRMKISPQLLPVGSLKPIAQPSVSEPFEWHAEDGEACFHTEGKVPITGWNMLEVEIEHDQVSAAACLTFDVGKGFDRYKSIYLAVRRGRIAKRICFVPRGTKRIRLEPLAGEGGNFTVKVFRFIWLTPRFAYSRMIRRLNYADRHFQGIDADKIISAIRQEGRVEKQNWKRLLIAYYEATFARGAPNFDYALWQEQIEPLREPSANRVAVNLHTLEIKPTFGLLLVGDRRDQNAWKQTLISIKQQRYPNWIIFVESKFREHLESFFSTCASQDKIDLEARIVLVDSIQGLAAALKQNVNTVDYLSILLVGDQLSENALYHMAVHAQDSEKSALLYSDEDVLEGGKRTLVNFKPGWNPDLLLSTNYIGLAAAFELTRFIRYLEKLEDPTTLNIHALLLSYSHELEVEQIQHIAYVGLHRSSYHSDGSYIQGISYSSEAVNEYLSKIGADTYVKDIGIGCQVSWNAPDPAPLVSLLIPTRNMVSMLQPCVEKILSLTEYPNFELIILDNQSDDMETLAYLEEVQQRDSRVRCLRWNYPFNYSAINNFGVSQSKGDIIALVNNDIEPINSTWLTEMVGHVCRQEVGCVGAKLYYPNDTVQHGGVILGLGGVAGHAHRFFPRSHSGFQNRLSLTQDLSAVTAACLLIRRDVYEEIGGLDEKHLPVAYNDVDLCLKALEKGYRNVWTPFAELYHHESVSRGKDDNPAKKARAKKEVDYFRARWSQEILHDPAYNPNLTVSFEDFSLR